MIDVNEAGRRAHLSEPDSAAEWLCFIDETGDFGDPNASVFVSAVLVECENEPTFIRRTRQAIGELAPLAPWPMHAWLAQRPEAHALWAIDRPQAAARHGLEACARAARLHWEAHAPEALQRGLERLKQGKEPRMDDLRELERTRDAQPCFIAFDSHTSTAKSRMSRIGRDLSDGKIMGVIAGESHPGQAPKGDRYLAVLKALLERIDELLALDDDARHVRLIVATRDVIHPILGQKTRLDRATLESVIARRPSGFHSGRTFRVGAIQSYDENVHPGLVLADFFANLTGRHVRGKSGLIVHDRHIRRTIGLSLCPGDPRRPHAAARGVAAEWIAASRAGENGARDFDPAWARDQALMLTQCWR